MAVDVALTARRPAPPSAPGSGRPVVDIAIPVYNEEAALERAVRRLHQHLAERFPLSARITVVDNGSADRTWTIARRLARDLPGVRALRLGESGRGRALRAAWSTSDAAVVAYMDVDLSTDLGALLALVAPLAWGEADVAIGSRRAPGARVERGLRRELISRSYNLILRFALQARFRDAQCGFKAVRADVARRLLPQVADQGWFFDTELLVLAQRAGLRIRELPVDWVDDSDSRVRIVATALADLRGVARLRRGRAPAARTGGRGRRWPGHPAARQLLSFAAVGLASTAAYAAVYAALRTALTAVAANAAALAITAVGNAAANRSLTFGRRGRAGRVGDHAAGAITAVAALGLDAASLAALHAVDPGAARAAELAALVTANAVATVARFVLLRRWMSGGGIRTRALSVL